MEECGHDGGKVNKPTDLLWTLLRISLGVLFLYASYYKIVTPAAFAHEINNYRLLPPWAVNPLALVLPWIQAVCGVALLTDRMTRGASVLLVIMMGFFQAAVASALVRGLNVSCGCFHAGGSAASWLTFSRDSLIFIATIVQLVRSWPCQAEGAHGAR